MQKISKRNRQKIIHRQSQPRQQWLISSLIVQHSISHLLQKLDSRISLLEIDKCNAIYTSSNTLHKLTALIQQPKFKHPNCPISQNCNTILQPKTAISQNKFSFRLIKKRKDPEVNKRSQLQSSKAQISAKLQETSPKSIERKDESSNWQSIFDVFLPAPANNQKQLIELKEQRREGQIDQENNIFQALVNHLCQTVVYDDILEMKKLLSRRQHVQPKELKNKKITFNLMGEYVALKQMPPKQTSEKAIIQIQNQFKSEKNKTTTLSRKKTTTHTTTFSKTQKAYNLSQLQPIDFSKNINLVEGVTLHIAS